MSTAAAAAGPVLSAASDAFAERRADVDSKQERIARLLREHQCEGLLVLEPANFRWLTAGGTVRGLHHGADRPALYLNERQRWVVCCNVDSQRLFDEEVDGLGFQLKEWPWYDTREKMVADLCANRRVACDVPLKDAKVVGPHLAEERRTLTAYETSRYGRLGQLLVHAVEATARGLDCGDAEDEVAGQLSHRLSRRGLEPVALQVAAEGRGKKYKRPGSSAARVQRDCTLQATAGLDGLYATAARTVTFGEPDAALRADHDRATRLMAVWLAATRVGEPAASAIDAGRRLFRHVDGEHEWRLAPPGFITGHTPVEVILKPGGMERFHVGKPVTWQAKVGAATLCDTYLVGDEGPKAVTPVESWPIRRVSLQGRAFDLPDLLARERG